MALSVETGVLRFIARRTPRPAGNGSGDTSVVVGPAVVALLKVLGVSLSARSDRLLAPRAVGHRAASEGAYRLTHRLSVRNMNVDDRRGFVFLLFI